MRGRFAACALLVLYAPARAAADPPDPPGDALKEQARALFASGSDFAAKSRWKDALAAFEQSGALIEHASIHYNIGFCERALGHATRARKSFRAALARDDAHGHEELSPGDRDSASKLAVEVDAQLARLDLVIRPASLRIAIDGRPVERDDASGEFVAGTRAPGPPESLAMPAAVVLADPGPHSITVSDAAGQRRVYDMTVAEKERRALRLEGPEAAVKPAVFRYWGAQRISALAVGGVALAALGFAIGFTVKASQDNSAAAAACPHGTNCPDDSAFEHSADAVREANFATGGYVAAGVAAATGVVLWFTAPSKPTAVSFDGVGARLRVAW